MMQRRNCNNELEAALIQRMSHYVTLNEGNVRIGSTGSASA